MSKFFPVTLSVTPQPPKAARWRNGRLEVRGVGEAKGSALAALVELGREIVGMGSTLLGVAWKRVGARVVQVAKEVGTLSPPGFLVVDSIPSVRAGEVFYAGQNFWGGWSWGDGWRDTGESALEWIEAAVTVLAWATVKARLGEVVEPTPSGVAFLLEEELGLEEEAMREALNPPRRKVPKGAEAILLPPPGPYAILAREAHRIAGVVGGQAHPGVAMDGYLASWGLKGVHLTPAPGFGWTGKARGLAGVFHMALLELASGGARFCQNCGRILHGRVNKRFCSDSCRVVWNRKRKRGKGN